MVIDLLVSLFGRIRRALVEIYYHTLLRIGSRGGVTRTKRNPELIVSLTTIPERIETVVIGLESLLRQKLKPDRIVLWLSQGKQPNGQPIDEDNLPARLRSLEERGVEVRWCDDIRSFRKIIPALRAFPKALIVTADDDIMYAPDWLGLLYSAYQREPKYIHCHLAHSIRYDGSGAVLPYNEWVHRAPGVQGPSKDLFPTSGAGVLYAPGHLHSEVLNEEAFLTLCPTADDVWLKAVSLMADVECKKVRPYTLWLPAVRIANNKNLFAENVAQGGNDNQIAAVARRYPCFKVPQRRRNSRFNHWER